MASAGTAPTFRAGQRYVWTSSHPPVLILSGTYVADGPAPFVTVRHDGWDHDAQVFADQLVARDAS